MEAKKSAKIFSVALCAAGLSVDDATADLILRIDAQLMADGGETKLDQIISIRESWERDQKKDEENEA